MAWFTANIGYHHIHHLNPASRSIGCRKFFATIPNCARPKTTSLHPVDIIRCLRLKVWDVETQRMVGVRNL